ncbi:hypothetical protein [uncultured Sphingomonas sp.]|uniref:WD40/YVTN/BNR-like repeat-containing protein n=1 Tax=uncultured Sphingomonas sp. TaxID=158754 RepID=UPI0025E4A985|nr:hypothetical protein [uncultured Sphingomonas sp.]
MRDKNGKILGELKADQVGPYGGGFVTSFSITDDAKVMVHGTDVGGGYVWGENDKLWRHVVTYESYPDLDALKDPNSYADSDGCYAIDIAPTNGQIGYCVFRGRLFKTTDQFKSVQLVPGGYFGSRSNTGGQRLWNDKLKIDPVDPKTFMVGSEGQGVYYSIDGGATLVRVAGIPAVTLTDSNYPLPITVAVDRTSDTVNGRKQHWVMWVPGSGLWETTSGPEGTWTKSVGSPAINIAYQMSIDHAGNILIAGGPNGIYQRTNGTWTKVSAFGAAASAVLKNNQQVSMGFNGDMNFTTAALPNAWTSDRWYPHYPLRGGIQYKADKVRWLNSGQSQLFPSKLMPDPITPNKVWLVHGTGIAWSYGPNGTDPIIWNDVSIGNGMLVTNRTIMTPDGNLLRAAWDQPIWTGKTDEEIDNPLDHSISEAFSHGWDIDWVPGKPNIVVACVNYQAEFSGMSTDGGKNFTTMFRHPNGATLGGNIGFVSETEGYWIPANNGKAVYTTDGGQNWSLLELTAKDGSTLPSGGSQGWNFAYYVNKKNLLISKEEPGVAYLYNNGSGGSGLAGVWRKEAGSTTFNQVFAGTIGRTGWFDWYMRLYEVPGMPGALILSPGNLADKPTVMRSADAGKTWTTAKTTLNGVEYEIVNCEDMGWGKAAPGSPYATCRFAGYINNVYGIYESFDNLKTVTRVGGHPAGMTYGLTGIAGHPTRFGEWYYGVGQMSWAKATRRHVLRFS